MQKQFLIFLFLAALLLFGSCAPLLHAQNVRYSVSFPSVSSEFSTPFLVANVPPNSPVLAVCNSPANQVPCTNYATTFTSSGVACANGSQDTPDPQPSACQSTGDAQGNIGFWAPPGKYDYTVCIQNSVSCFGPYTVTLGQIAGNGFPALPQLGGCLRFNVNGDNAWDAVSCAQRNVIVFWDFGRGELETAGASAIQPTLEGTTTDVYPTSSAGGAVLIASTTSGASTSTNVGINQGSGGNFGSYGIGSFYDWSLQIAAGNGSSLPASYRYWLGMFVQSSSGQSPLSSTTLVTDTPAWPILAYRASQGTDTNWQAAACNGTSCTFVNTLVPIDASEHTYDIFNPLGIAATYYIDHNQVAQITTNLPAPFTGNSSSMAMMFWCGDNKNVANTVSAIFYGMGLALK